MCALSQLTSPCLWRNQVHIHRCPERGPLFGSRPWGRSHTSCCQLPSTSTFHHLGTRPGLLDPRTFQEKVYITNCGCIWGLRVQRHHHMGTKCYHRLLARPTELSAHRRYLPNTWMTPHWPSQEVFSLLPSLTSSRPRAHLASRARLQLPFWTLPVKGLSGPIITNFASSRGL